MARPYTPRAAFILWGLSFLFIILSALGFATGQPNGAISLSMGLAMGLNLATVVMVGEVRKARASG